MSRCGFEHQPVLTNEVIWGLNLKPKGVYVDCTLGGGGHSLAILKTQPDCRVVGIDQDLHALDAAGRRLAEFGARVELVHGNFRKLDNILSRLNINAVDGVLMDLGVSSPQLDQAERGFSYQQDARLDMRMDPEQELTAYDLVNKLSKSELARIIREYGEERWATRIASLLKHIVKASQSRLPVNWCPLLRRQFRKRPVWMVPILPSVHFRHCGLRSMMN